MDSDLFVRFLWLYTGNRGNAEEMGFSYLPFWWIIRIFAVLYPLMYEVWHFAVTGNIWI